MVLFGELSEDVVEESDGRNILEAWAPTCEDEATCAACDFRHFCPRPAGNKINVPTAP